MRKSKHHVEISVFVAILTNIIVGLCTINYFIFTVKVKWKNNKITKWKGGDYRVIGGKLRKWTEKCYHSMKDATQE